MRSILAAVAVCLIGLSSPAHAQQAEQASSPPTTASAVTTLRPGDLLRVSIWREQDLSGEFLVNERGVVTLPMLGDQSVTGIAVDQLRDALIAAYREQLRNPSITITPLRRVNVLGEVGKPGLYPVDPTISLAGAIAMAGGATPTGDLNRIRIIRDGQVLHERVAAAESLTAADVRSGDQIVVDRRGWFDRNSTFLVSAILSVTSIVISLSR
jgi:protein involved in polysaccharide export with SLBB domain